jgi:hypothetical protein
MKRRDAMGLLGAMVLLTGCGSDTYSWNQKLIVTVQTPDGLKSGSAVTRVTISVGDGGLNGHVMNQSIAGEATVVDLGQGKYLFALLSESNKWEAMTANLAEFTFRDKLPDVDVYKSDRENLGAKYSILQKLREARTIPVGSVPLLVTFTDISNPASVKELKPLKLEDVLGQGYILTTVNLEIADESPTNGLVEKILKWLPRYFDQHLDGNSIETIKSANRLANSLASGNFTTWRQ